MGVILKNTAQSINIKERMDLVVHYLIKMES